jgi:hypothetical protein
VVSTYPLVISIELNRREIPTPQGGLARGDRDQGAAQAGGGLSIAHLKEKPAFARFFSPTVHIAIAGGDRPRSDIVRLSRSSNDRPSTHRPFCEQFETAGSARPAEIFPTICPRSSRAPVLLMSTANPARHTTNGQARNFSSTISLSRLGPACNRKLPGLWPSKACNREWPLPRKIESGSRTSRFFTGNHVRPIGNPRVRPMRRTVSQTNLLLSRRNQNQTQAQILNLLCCLRSPPGIGTVPQNRSKSGQYLH